MVVVVEVPVVAAEAAAAVVVVVVVQVAIVVVAVVVVVKEKAVVIRTAVKTTFLILPIKCRLRLLSLNPTTTAKAMMKTNLIKILVRSDTKLKRRTNCNNNDIW